MRGSGFGIWFSLAFLAFSIWIPLAPVVASASELEAIPKKPSAPPNFNHPHPPIDSFNCPRYYLYRGKSLPCDSFLAWDGENMRPIFSKTPAALAELDAYQKTRRDVRNLRYIGGAGALLALTEYLFTRALIDDRNEQIVVRNITVIGGMSLALGSFTYGLVVLRSNERRLDRAVELHNQANPKDPITLQLTTGIQF